MMNIICVFFGSCCISAIKVSFKDEVHIFKNRFWDLISFCSICFQFRMYFLLRITHIHKVSGIEKPFNSFSETVHLCLIQADNKNLTIPCFKKQQKLNHWKIYTSTSDRKFCPSFYGPQMNHYKAKNVWWETYLPWEIKRILYSWTMVSQIFIIPITEKTSLQYYYSIWSANCSYNAQVIPFDSPTPSHSNVQFGVLV